MQGIQFYAENNLNSHDPELKAATNIFDLNDRRYKVLLHSVQR